MKNKFSIRVVLRIISAISLLVALGWLILQPGPEPLLAILGLTATLIGSYFKGGGTAKAVVGDETYDEMTPDHVTQPNALPSKKEIQERIESTLSKSAIVDHERLFGVNRELEQLEHFLSTRDSNWIISLFGEGGIGKTALAYEAVKQFAVEANFTRFAWVSAQQRYFSADVGAKSVKQAKLQWADLVRQIADQLEIGLGYARTTWLDDFRNSVKKLPDNEKLLIVIDNLETIDDISVVRYFDDPLTNAERIVNPHKVLINTRRSIQDQAPSVVEISLSGLSQASAYQFIRDLGRANDAIVAASDEELRPILTVTEGNPLLIKLVVRRFLHARKSIPLVLQELQELGESQVADELRNYLYVRSLEELETSIGEDTAKLIMNAFCPLPAGDQLTYSELKDYSGIDDMDTFEAARQLACDLSLIRVSGSAREVDTRFTVFFGSLPAGILLAT